MAGATTDTDILQATETQFDNYSCAAAAALLLYEYVITLGEESRFIWRDVRTGYATLFMINRLNMICIFIATIGELISWHNIVGCKAIQVLYVIVVLNICLTWAAVATLRIYAISNHSVCLAIVTGVLAFVPVVGNIVGNTTITFYIGQFGVSSGCYANSSLSPQNYSMLLILTRAATIASDVLVLMVTLRQLLGTVRSSVLRETWASSTLAALILRDGAAYFVLFLLLNVAQIIAGLMLERFNPLPTFILPMTCIVISRLTLNLRRFAYTRHGPSTPEARFESHSHQASLLSVAVFRGDSQLSDGPGAFREV